MSLFDGKQFQGFFPFSPSLLGQMSASLARVADDSAGTQRDAATEPASQPTASGRHKVLRSPISTTAARLLPLETFLWGSNALPPQPRTRVDHVLIWVTAGQAQLDFPRRQHRMRAGELRLVPAGTAFAALPMAGARGHVALLPAALVAEAAPALADVRDGVHVGAEGAALLALLTRLAAPDTGPARARDAVAMLARRLGSLDLAPAPAGATRGARQDRPLVERFLALAEARLTEPGSLAEIAAELRSTMSALDQACIAARGRRAIELLHELRLSRAATLLREGSQSPADIALALGYSSHAHFTRAFVAASGRSPEAFRARPC